MENELRLLRKETEQMRVKVNNSAAECDQDIKELIKDMALMEVTLASNIKNMQKLVTDTKTTNLETRDMIYLLSGEYFLQKFVIK